jgi:hypothetical protein
MDEEQKTQLIQLYQMRKMYEMITNISSDCFDLCVPKLNNKLEKQEENCMALCAARYLEMKVIFDHRLKARAAEVE